MTEVHFEPRTTNDESAAHEAMRTADMGPRALAYAENIHRQILEIYSRLGVASFQELRALPIKKLRGRAQDIVLLKGLCTQLEKTLRKPDVIAHAVLDEQMAHNTLAAIDELAKTTWARPDDTFDIGIGRARIAYIRGDDWRQYLYDVATGNVRLNWWKARRLAGAYARCGDFLEADVIVALNAGMDRDPIWICTRIKEFLRHGQLDEALEETRHFFSVGTGGVTAPIAELYAALMQQGRADGVEALCRVIDDVAAAFPRASEKYACVAGLDILIHDQKFDLVKEGMAQKFIEPQDTISLRIHLAEEMKKLGDPEGETFAVQAFDAIMADPVPSTDVRRKLERACAALRAMTPEIAQQRFPELVRMFAFKLRCAVDRVDTGMLATLATCAHTIGADPKPYFALLGEARRDALAKLVQSGAHRTTGIESSIFYEPLAMTACRKGIDEAVAWATCGHVDQATAVARTLHAREGDNEEHELQALLGITDVLLKSKKVEDTARAKEVLEEAIVAYVNNPAYTKGGKRGTLPKQIVEAKMQFGETDAKALCHFARDMGDGEKEIALYLVIAQHVYAHGGDVKYVMDLADRKMMDVVTDNAFVGDSHRVLNPFCLTAAAVGCGDVLKILSRHGYISSSIVSVLFDDIEARLLRAKQVLSSGV